MVYKADLTPEYVIHPEGLALYSGGAYGFQFNLTDHLGNVRAVLNASAAVQQANDYFPFGLTHATVANIAKNKYLYNGKELQNDVLGGIVFDQLDYGARFYDPVIGRWHVADPLAEQNRGLSPFAYGGNNPVNFVDPTGMEIEPGSLKEWEKLKGQIEKQRNKLQSGVDKLTAKAEAKGWSAEKLAGKIGDKVQRLSSLNGSLSTMGTLENSSQVYGLSHTKYGENGGVTLNTKNTNTDVIDIKFLGTANFVHEMTHAGQFETGDIAFNKSSGQTLGQDVYDEISAYKAQFAYDPFSVSGLTSTSVANSFGTITPAWVQGLQDATGNMPYSTGGSAHTGHTSLNINSTKKDFINAYPNDLNARFLPANFILRNLLNVYYKR